MNTIPILLYHCITNQPSQRMAPFTVTPDDFARHMDLIVEKGFRCLTVSQLVDQLHDPQLHSNDKICAVTFDDGFADFATNALPTMNARHIPSTLYLTSGWMDGGTTEHTPRPTDKFLSWSQIPELAEAGVEIGAHSHSHPQMDTLDSAHAIYELTRSKALIEDTLTAPIRSFAYPHGYNSRRLRRLTAEAGYDSATAVRNMLSHNADDTFRLARMMLMNTNTPTDVAAWLDGLQAKSAPQSEELKTIGWRSYRRTKAMVLRKPGTDYA